MARRASKNPSPRRASLAAPLPQGERGNRVCVAQIGAAHGIRGQVRLWSFTEEPEAVASYGVLETEDGGQFEIEEMRPAKGFFVAQIKGVTDRNAAERLTNLKLYIPRGRLPPTKDPDTFYHADLVGLAAVDASGNALGTVTAIYRYGATDTIEITPAGGGDTLLVPFTHETVPTIDIAGGRIVAVPLPEAQDDDDS